MHYTSTRAAFAFALLAAGLAGGCASGDDGPSTSLLSAVKAPSLPSLSSVASIATPEPAQDPVGSATEIYARVARGANTCWFAGPASLKKDYIYHAEADAPSRGGKAEIVVHVRDVTQPNPRGAKAFRVNIDPTSETTATVKTENLKMPDDLAKVMSADVARWSKGDQGCSTQPTTAGWDAAAPAAATAAAKPAKAPAGKAAPKLKPAVKTP